MTVNRILDIFKKILKKCWGFFPWYKGLYKGRAWYTKTALGIVSFFVAVFIYLGMVDMNFLWLFGKSPGFHEIKTPPTYDASLIYSADSVLIGKYFKEKDAKSVMDIIMDITRT